jgi:HAD superfamily hydrolase (TIGR01509 family)
LRVRIASATPKVMDIKVITFDLDGVYFPNGKANFISALEKLGISEEEAKRVFLKSSQMNQEYKNGKMNDEQFWSWAVSEWKLDKIWQEIVKLMIDGYDVNENIVSIVKNLRTKGYKTAICSNNFPARVNGLQEKFGFLDNFDIKVFSFEVGEGKPSKKIFEELVKQSQVEPSAVVFADDNPDSLSGAKEVGITTFLYEGFDKYLEQLESVGVKI